MKPIFIANWKMNLLLDDAFALINQMINSIKDESDLENIIIAPPLPYISILSKNYPQIKFAAQDVSFYKNFGSHTGEVSAKMIKNVGSSYTIIGHSERRANSSEANQIVKTKLENSIEAGITPILCVGESLESRKQKNHLNFIEDQLIKSLGNVQNIEHLIIAYEPVWAIGTKIIPTIAEIEEVVGKIKDIVGRSPVAKNIDLVYGGSVNSTNHQDILSAKDISGVLVGSASLDAKELVNMVQVR